MIHILKFDFRSINRADIFSWGYLRKRAMGNRNAQELLGLNTHNITASQLGFGASLAAMTMPAIETATRADLPSPLGSSRQVAPCCATG
jgi:hypothetical protein